MPENISNIMISSLFVGITVVALMGILVKIIKNVCAPTRTEPAVVLDKQVNKSFSKYAGKGVHEKYVVVFSVDGKKKAFYVSQFSYGGYKKGENGMLTYKGDRIIDFK